MFIANTPGHDCATAIKSIKSSSLAHCLLSTTVCFIKGIMAYPPPIVNRPILAKVMNNSNIFFFVCKTPREALGVYYVCEF